MQVIINLITKCFLIVSRCAQLDFNSLYQKSRHSLTLILCIRNQDNFALSGNFSQTWHSLILEAHLLMLSHWEAH